MKPTIRIEKLAALNNDALALIEEYYEAVHVVLRDPPNKMQVLLDEPASGIWLAYLDDIPAGCVILRKLQSIPDAAECKRLYVRPFARGHRVSDLLLNAQEEFARNYGIQWIYLDTYDDLKAAISLYQHRGYTQCERYNNNPQATIFMRKQLI